ncbi:MAG: hypothetical protein J5842_01095 [Lachnospiraceae bacterium]|nr:hypothetical protein [Lachnospiraceae bacterium]
MQTEASEKSKKIVHAKIATDEWLFIVLFGFWFFVCCMYDSEWRRITDLKTLRSAAGYGAYFVCIWVFFFNRTAFNVKRFMAAAAFMIVALISGSLSGNELIPVCTAWIIAARNMDKDRIVRVVCIITVCSMLIIFASVLLGFIPSLTEESEILRNRMKLGYTYTSYSSHFMLFVTLMAMSAVKKPPVWLGLILIGANYVIYLMTDTRVDLLLAVAGVLAAFLFSRIKLNDKYARVLAVLACLVPVFLLVISYAAQYFYDPADPVWIRLNEVFNSRLVLGHDMMMSTPHTLLGQKIKWITASRMSAKKPYNYVDNFYLHCGLNQGILYLAFIVGGYAYALRSLVRQRKLAMASAVMVVLLHGLVDPQMGSLYWQPFIIFLALCFEEEDNKNICSMISGEPT